MNRSTATLFGLAFGASLLLGCGAADVEGDGAQFPEPIGYDEAMQAHPGAAQTAAMSAPDEQPAPAPSLAPGEVPGTTSEARAAAAPRTQTVQDEQGDIVVGADADQYADTDPSALTDFRATLDPYGTWVDDGTYGTVWQPSSTVVGADFSPYVTGGHWTYDDEWVWASDYDWGWAPFHYGRWVYIGGRGWAWIPGRTYAGAWVSWRYGDPGYGYVGWAPMPPSWYWYGGVAVGIAVVPRAPYVFCGYHDVFYPNVAGRIVAGPQVAAIAGHTRPYVPAAPTVGGSVRTPAHPTVGGPPPSSLGIARGDIFRTPPNDRGILHAQQFAQASTARGFGARPPAQVTVGNRVASAPSITNVGTRSSFAPSRGWAVATAPRYQGVAPSRAPLPSYGAYGTNVPRGPLPAYNPGGPRFTGVAPRSFAAPSYGGLSPHYGSMGSIPSYAPHTFGGGYSGGVVPGTSSGHHAPEYAAPPPAGRSSGGFRGGGGGVHFGGGGVVRGGGGRR